MNTAQSNAAGDRRERRFTLKLLTQIGIIFGICWISTCIEQVLPFTLPASIIGMLLLLVLLQVFLCLHLWKLQSVQVQRLKPEQLRQRRVH